MRVNWDAIKAAHADEDCIVILNRRVAAILSSVWHTYEWEATFRTGTYDYSDWDYLQRILAQSEEYLGTPLPLADLLVSLSQITAAIGAIRSAQTICCDQQYDITNGDAFTDSVIDGVGNVPQNIIDAGYATGVSDWSGFDDYKCMIVNVALDSAINKCLQLGQLIDTGALVAAGIGAILLIIGAIWAGPALVLFGGVLASAGTAAQLFEELLTKSSGDLSDLASDLQANRETIVCAMYVSDGAGAVYQSMLDQIETDIGVDARLIVSLLNMEPEIKALYGGRYDAENIAQDLADLGFAVSTYDCTACQEAPGDYYMSWSQGGLYSDQLPSSDPCNWSYHNYTPFGQGNPSPSWAIRNRTGSAYDASIQIHSSQLLHLAGLSTTNAYRISIKRLTFDYGGSTIHAQCTANGRAIVFDDSADPDTTITFLGTRGTWTPKSQDFTTVYRDHPAGSPYVNIVQFFPVEESGDGAHLVDNVKIWYDIAAL